MNGDDCEFNGKEHDKVYSHAVITTAPPKQKWICRTCGTTGWDNRDGPGSDEYQKIWDKHYFYPV